MSSALTVVDRELWQRRLTWSDLGRKIGVSDQVMANWRKRGLIPASRYAAIAGFFGWSVEQVMGDARATTEPDVRENEQESPFLKEPVFTKRAHEIAQMLEGIADPAMKELFYSAACGMLKLAFACQSLPIKPAPKKD